MPNKLRDPHDPARVLDDDGHPLAVVRTANLGPRPRARKPAAPRLEDATVRALVDDLEAVVTWAATTPATRSRVSERAQSEAGGRSGANRAAVRALVSAYYADDGLFRHHLHPTQPLQVFQHAVHSIDAVQCHADADL